MDSTRICLIRHGEAAWNTERRIQGQTDIGLAPAGVEQACAVALQLSDVPAAALYCSDLLRARQTAEAIGARLALPPILVPELRERCYGVFEGKTYDEACAAYPEDYAVYERRDPDYAFPAGGESLNQVYARVTKCLRRLAAAHPAQTIVAVTHGGVLDIINRFVRGRALDLPRDFLIPNTGINWLVVRDDHWQIDVWGETTHLMSAGPDELR